MNETPIYLTLGLERAYGPRVTWPLAIEAAHAQLGLLEQLAPSVYGPALGCAVEAVYGERARPTRYDFLGVHRQWAFESRFGVEASAEVNLAFLTCRHLRDLLGANHYQRVVSIAWEASRCEQQAEEERGGARCRASAGRPS
ncbi:MAG: hypothetical protein HOZ81_32805 [Streptomyces sp.]|nr:hypothetical protein [Streptomyces sp.]NUS89456.1 hypothetical protein [Streptomyces sp.]